MAQDRPGWELSERAELDNHEANRSFEWLDRSVLPSGRKLVKMTWAYKIKRTGKKKSRLCVQGCSQIPGVDYDQTHCSTMRPGSLRLLSSLAAKYDLGMRRWDFVSAFLQGDLLDDEVVYCSAPPGHPRIGADGQPQIVKVLKPIYGMAQAGRRWQRSLYPWLLEHLGEDSQLHSDRNVFSCCRENTLSDGSTRFERLIVGCYVDDLYILSSHRDAGSLYDTFISDLQARWDVEDEGDVSDLLGVEIAAVEGGVKLKQTAYIEKMCNAWFPNGVPNTIQSNQTPCDKDLAQLVCDAVVSTADPDPILLRRYQSLVGALIYASTNTRPDVTYAVGMLCRAMARPTPALFEAALRVLGYLYRTREIGLRYAADQRPLYGMSDSDWAEKHSTTGWVFMYNSAAISWASKKQESVALSSCEAELMAVSDASKEAVYLREFLTELGELSADSPPLPLSVDNTAARDVAYNPEHHGRIKHIKRRHHFVRECIENMEISVPFVSTHENIADFFTKFLPGSQFFHIRDQIMNVKVRPPPRSPGGSGK